MTFRAAHFSDVHLGFEQYSVLSVSGNNLRGEDIVRAFTRNVTEIVTADPALVLLSGDVGDRPQLPIRYLLLMRDKFSQLASLRPDGSRRQLVIISGNHDQPRSRRDACFLELFRGLPGVHVVTTDYEIVRVGEAENAPAELEGVLVHALPHDLLKEVDFDRVEPVEGSTNIFMAHGVAGGSELFTRTLGREFAIPVDVLARKWDYIALGHYHKQGPVVVGGYSEHTTPVWYAGSTENMGFRDLLHGGGGGRGHLLVDIARGMTPQVTRVNLPVRSMLRLPTLEAEGMAPNEIATALFDATQIFPLAGAVVEQLVRGVTREVWNLVDRTKAERAAQSAAHFEIRALYRESESSVRPTPLGDLGTQLEQIVLERVSEDLREDVRTLATALLGQAWRSGEGEENPGSTTEVEDHGDESTAQDEDMESDQEVAA